jgi:hypothetical protein
LKSPGLTVDVRRACARVAGRARSVRIDDDALSRYADALPAPIAPADDPGDGPPGFAVERAAFVLCLDAINFGSGWFPTLRKRPGVSGYHTVLGGLRARFAAAGPWPLRELARIDPTEVASALGQDPEHELMSLYAAALREVGERISGGWDGDWLGPVREAGGSAVALAELVGSWKGWHDVSSYDGSAVPFFKRAQILAADLHRAGVARFRDLGELTMFADNLVPHVLRLDGVLAFDADLLGRIDAGLLLEHGAPDEVEIRACAVEAVERIVARRPDHSAVGVDQLLWLRGADARYKSRPRHRARCTAY